VPLRLRIGRPDGSTEIVTRLLTEPVTEIPVGPATFVHPAADGIGYYGWVLAEPDLAALAAHRAELTATERLSAIHMLGLHHTSGELTIAQLLGRVEPWLVEPEPRARVALAGLLARIELVDRLEDEPLAARARSWLRQRLGPWLREVGDPVPDEPLDRVELRQVLIDALAWAEDADVRQQAHERARRWLADPGSVDPGLVEVSLRVLAEDEPSVGPELLARAEAEADPTRKALLLRAYARLGGEAGLEAALAAALAPSRPYSEWLEMAIAMDGRTAERERDEILTATFAAWPALSEKLPPALRAKVGYAGRGCSEARVARVADFYAEFPLPGMEQVLADLRAETAACRATIAADGPALAAFLAEGR
jgi:hypothetical protein